MAKRIEFMCTHCGRKVTKPAIAGRPEPGKCPKRTPGQPHRWVVNRRYEG